MINANLKRVFGADLDPDLPDRFVDLLNQLQQIDQDNADPSDTSGKRDTDEV